MSDSLSFLDRLADRDRAALQSCWRERRFRRGEMIIGHREESRDVFFVLAGRARATVYSEAGKAVAYRDIEPGHIFGELAAIDSGKRSASVVALEPLVAARLSASAFRGLVDSSQGLRWVLFMHLSGQIRRLSERVFEFSTLVVRKRLVRELLRLARETDANGALVDPAPRHFDLAARISTHREAVSRELSALRRKKLIGKHGRALHLLDVAALAALGDDRE